MTTEKPEQRYFPSETELSVLIPKLKEYFTYPERSTDRKTVVNQTYDMVKDLADHWNVGKIRLWFNNNKNIYIGKDPRRIPTPILKPDKLEDPNKCFKIEINPTPINAPSPLPFLSIASNSIQKNESSSLKFNFFTTPEISNTNTSNSQFPDDLDMPDVPDISAEGNFDEMKFQHYKALRLMYNAISKISSESPSRRVKYQSIAEDRMTQILTQMHDHLNLKDICTNDSSKTCKRVMTSGSKNIQRQYSQQTGTYAEDKLSKTMAVEFEETCENVFIPKNLHQLFQPSEKISKNLSFILRGECETETIQLSESVECVAISSKGDLAYVYLSNSLRAHVLHLSTLSIPENQFNVSECDISKENRVEKEVVTGFFWGATSMYFDEIDNRIYVVGDCRIKCFDASNLTLLDTFLASGATLVASSCLTVKHNDESSYLVFGSKGIIALWNINKERPNRQSSCKTHSYEDIAKSQELDLSLIEWTRGRPPESSYKPENSVQNITSICSMGDFIIFASDHHHSIHILDNECKNIIGRLVGHVGGITKLLPINSNMLLSASKDCTMKIWNIENMCATHHVIRHAGPISALFGILKFENVEFMFSSGKDSTIRGWNLTRAISTFEIRLKEQEVPIELRYIENKHELIAFMSNEIKIYKFKKE
ncbi:hypothetical protein TRFO_27460 [Tritrichomonas foetus]|uniref:Uncharacterized protein n=1 Tax=Tritrichomonas foetus TaxID=1144522 RepID=A0A1J4K1X0_9EUKA|nr:hypothetical protein TRFO_27460 [Tritrichomonas foetus]|eukprot:OHT04954.1 hypothetical protein TRFO_27460 [Tritrichomonas foetus]